MPTPSQSQDRRLKDSRLDSQEQRLDNLASRMDKYDEIIDDLRVIVVALKTSSATNQKWIASMLTIGATILGATIGIVATHFLK
jgi:hypothetical protein